MPSRLLKQILSDGNYLISNLNIKVSKAKRKIIKHSTKNILFKIHRNRIQYLSGLG